MFKRLKESDVFWVIFMIAGSIILAAAMAWAVWMAVQVVQAMRVVLGG